MARRKLMGDYLDIYNGLNDGLLDDFVAHIGKPHDGLIPHSGRYEYGSGKDPYQRSLDFYGIYNDLKDSGEFKNDTEIAKAMGLSSTQLRAMRSISKDEIGKHLMVECKKYKDLGWSGKAIAEKLNLSGESQVRSLLNRYEKGSADKTRQVADILKEQVADKKYLDISKGVENQLGITANRLNVAAAMLENEGYRIETIRYQQVSNPSQHTNMKVLVKADSSLSDREIKSDIYQHRDEVRGPNGIYLEDDGKTIRGINKELVSIDPKRVTVRYAENGGDLKDGVIELKRTAPDLSLGAANYAQVRIKVGDNHYLKGMAVYGDEKDFPKGVDIIFNTNKHTGTPMMSDDKNNTVLKILKDDPDNPFGATIKSESELIRAQTHWTDKDGKKHQSPINIVNEEGNWADWKKTISSQVLSKQPLMTAKKQLKIASDNAKAEFDEIMAVENPIVRRKLLMDYAGDADKKAVDLRGAAFPRQASQVILPLTTIKPNEIYAPNYEDGEEVVLIRYPHGGKFEIPKLTVNNRNREGRRVITPNGADAVGINHQVAEQLSGADFDGDTVTVIPIRGQNIKVEKARRSLVEFNPSDAYPAYEGMPEVGQGFDKKGNKKDGFQKQKMMGIVSNLITDMTIKGASVNEIEPVVKYSMVIIDAEKHNLNWKQAQKDFNIEGLKKRYQQNPNSAKGYGGASTLVSKASGSTRIDQIDVSRPIIDPKTGEVSYKKTGRAIDKGNVTWVNPKTGKKSYKEVWKREDGSYAISVQDKDGNWSMQDYKPKGKIEMRTTETTPMASTKDAHTLSSGTRMEEAYANYANTMKYYANTARKEAYVIKAPKRNSEAAKQYKAEVESLTAKLNTAKANSSRERQANLIADKAIEVAKKSDPDRYYGPDGKDEMKKLRTQTLKAAREKTGANKVQVSITDREAEAIQANAISASMLEEIMQNGDMDQIRSIFTPKDNKAILRQKVQRAKMYADNGYTNAEIAKALGVSTGTVSDYLYNY